MKAKAGCFQFFFASEEDDLPYPEIPTRDVTDTCGAGHKTEPHLERNMENWCQCRPQFVSPNVQRAIKLCAEGGQHYMILTTEHPKSGDPVAVGILEFSTKGYRTALSDFPRRWSKKTYLPYVGSRHSLIVSWRSAFKLGPWMNLHEKAYLPGKRYGIVNAPDDLLGKVVSYFVGKKNQTDKFLKNVYELERRLRKGHPQEWENYRQKKIGTAGNCRKTQCQ